MGEAPKQLTLTLPVDFVEALVHWVAPMRTKCLILAVLRENGGVFDEPRFVHLQRLVRMTGLDLRQVITTREHAIDTGALKWERKGCLYSVVSDYSQWLPPSQNSSVDHVDPEWARGVKSRDGRCLLCGSTTYLHAHHIVPRRERPQLAYDLNNGATLCATCHGGIKNRESTVRALLTDAVLAGNGLEA